MKNAYRSRHTAVYAYSRIDIGFDEGLRIRDQRAEAGEAMSIYLSINQSAIQYRYAKLKTGNLQFFDQLSTPEALHNDDIQDAPAKAECSRRASATVP